MSFCYDFAVIGAGAAGLAASVTAASFGDRVILIDKNNMIGRKITASGNGRCNLMNNRYPRYFGDKEFAENVMRNCGKENLIHYWSNLGILLSEEAEGRLYPCTFMSSTVTDAYKTQLKLSKTEIRLQTAVKTIAKEKDIFCVATEKESFKSRRVLISCGGSANPKLGGTDNGYKMLTQFHHTVLPVKPALCPITTDQQSISGLAGIRVRCTARLKNKNGEIIQQEKGEALFTEYGISGICIMQMSRAAETGFIIELDMTERIFPDEIQLIHFLNKRKKQIPDFSPDTLLHGILAPKISYAVLKQAGIEMKKRKARDLDDSEISAIAKKSRKYTMTVTGNRGMEEAQVTSGGAECSEFIPETMESKIVKGLYAAGEILNVYGDCGGFNLMFATASGILAGINGRKAAVL